MSTIPISNVETQICSETTSESDEVIKKEKSLSPMSITPEVTSDEWEKKSQHRLSELDVKSKIIDQLRKDIENTRATIELLMKEKKSLGMKLAEFEEPSLTAKSNSKTMIENLKSELKSWEERRNVKEIQSKELWSAIQSQDDANVKLKVDAEERIDRESKMKEELILLRKALKNSKKKDHGDEYLYISSATNDWKLSLERDLKGCRNGRNGPSVESPRKLNGWQQLRMIRHLPRKNVTGVKNCTEPHLKGHCVKADISTRKCNRMINISRKPRNLAKARSKKNRQRKIDN